MDDKCSHINRAPIVLKGKFIGAPSIGQCEKDALPGMVVCGEHADKEAMAYYICTLTRRVEQLEAQLTHIYKTAEDENTAQYDKQSKYDEQSKRIEELEAENKRIMDLNAQYTERWAEEEAHG